MAPKPTRFTPVEGFENFSPIPDMPAARMMQGDDGSVYEQGFSYTFDDGRYRFFNGRLAREEIVNGAVRVIPTPDPVGDAIDAARGGVGGLSLVWEPEWRGED